MNKKKIINDPVYGFITIPTELVYDLIDHPYFQRLRYIKQVGMTHLVYPGALHTRFHHALGAMHLMGLAIETLCSKGQEITPDEKEGLIIAILLHDIGHGPFSHALEHSLVNGIKHEAISTLMMHKMNAEFNGALTPALEIFEGKHPKKFLQQLICGQLDLDRMDYLNRDSYFTGVIEGAVSFDRIIKMFNVLDNNLVIEEKGIYSIENFLISRRIMYWQVYLHKTSIAAEELMVKILERAKFLSAGGEMLFATPALGHFLNNKITEADFHADETHLAHFSSLDDQDIYTAVKVWANSTDRILSILCKMLTGRNLYKVEITGTAPDPDRIAGIKERLALTLGITEEETKYFIFTDTITNRAYNAGASNIFILRKNNEIIDIAKASDLSNLQSLDKTVKKHILCYT
ncbi:MAG: HD domain-containing protein, partial [Pedobacter sp.]